MNILLFNRSVRSTESMRSIRSCRSCQDSRSPKRITCTCHPHRSIPLERKKESKCCRFKKCKRHTRQLMPLCICVRTSSSENFRSVRRHRSPCPVFSKYGECCCIRHRVRNKQIIITNKTDLTSIAMRKYEIGYLF